MKIIYLIIKIFSKLLRSFRLCLTSFYIYIYLFTRVDTNADSEMIKKLMRSPSKKKKKKLMRPLANQNHALS